MKPRNHKAEARYAELVREYRALRSPTKLQRESYIRVIDAYQCEIAVSPQDPRWDAFVADYPDIFR